MKDKPADVVMRALCVPAFWRLYRFFPHFVEPRYFSEKLWSRMLIDRNPIWTQISDKFLVRKYVESRVGSQYLIPLLWRGEDPDDIPFDDLPLQFVIKANHGCGYNVVVKDKTALDLAKTRRKLRKWLRANFGRDTYLGIAWGYRNIIPTIIVEAFIGEGGRIPLDYKFYCFAGRVQIVTLHSDRFEEHRIRAFDRELEPLERGAEFKQCCGVYERPSDYETMVQLSERLSEEFDFVRVDLYNVNNRIYFGELTPYPGGVSALRGFDVPSMDRVLGEKWKLKRDASV